MHIRKQAVRNCVTGSDAHDFGSIHIGKQTIRNPFISLSAARKFNVYQKAEGQKPLLITDIGAIG